MDLKIVGAGQLGVRLAVLWKAKFPDSSIYLKTNHKNHERSSKWESLGFKALSTEEENDSNRITTPFVAFCAPPTNNPNYANDIHASIQNDWKYNSTDDKGFVFTASGGVYVENSGGVIDEDSDVSSDSVRGKSTERSKLLLSAEQIVLKNNGVVVRLGALYTKTSGAHTFWLSDDKSNEVSSSPNGWINLIHYDDAARCVMAALLGPPKPESKRLLLASDGTPMTRENICKAALMCPMFQHKKLPNFVGNKKYVDGKRYKTSLILQTLDWNPIYHSFEDFMLNHYNKEMNVAMFW